MDCDVRNPVDSRVIPFAHLPICLIVNFYNPLVEQGRQQGLIEAKQETLIEQMQLKFGILPEPMIQNIQSIQELDRLNTFLRRVITTSRLEEMGIEDGFVTKNE